MKSPLVGFSGDKVYPLGAVTLLVTAGANPKQVTIMVGFVVVDCPSSYNIILGMTALNAIKVIISTYHLLIRFPTEYGLEGRGRPDFHGAEPIKELEEVILGNGEPEKKVNIGFLLPPGIKDKLTQFLRKNQDVFAWVHEDIPGIDPTIIEHRLNVNPNFKPIRQKRRTFTPERNQAISEEVEKLLKADFIQKVYIPDWLANVVLVKKISMYTSDREKMAFITDRGLYYYKIMPFGLKNAGARYQRLVNAMLKHQIGRNIEVYVEDMLMKSLKAEDHLTDL
ncbi:uncharacterized protein LOC132309870 [Cornus florida]|uniref:uncharacterized protein LOC132309870 n=1 Tax=Cornus florida TaxID=4283 RepID=UPI0028A26F06|nr:uncharacterized protein LOC132309870 [Cornus florida]